MESLPPTFVPGFHDPDVVNKMKYKDFGDTGLKVSTISLGTAGFSTMYGEYSLDDCKAVVHNAIKAGINYIDTAPWYGAGTSEDLLGICLADIPRQAYYLATKVGRYEPEPEKMFDFSSQKTQKSVDTSLQKLKLDYVDVIQVHDIEFAQSLDIIVKETLPTLEKFVKAGKAKFIGITGYKPSTLNECLTLSATKINTILSYSRLSLLDNSLLKFLPNFQARKLGIVNAAPHCMGLLTNNGCQDWHPALQDIKDICVKAQDTCKKESFELARLALYYALEQKGPHTTLIGMNTLKLLKSNLDVYYNGITAREKEVLSHLQSSFFSQLAKGDWEKENDNIKNCLPKIKGNIFL